MRILIVIIAMLLLSLGAFGQSQVPPSYKLDAQQNNVLEIWNLNAGSDCHPDRIRGRVTAREFDQRGTLVIGFTIGNPDGTRQYINVDTRPEEWDRLTAGWVVQGLQLMTVPGSRVEVVIHLCGAAGRVVVLDAIRRLR